MIPLKSEEDLVLYRKTGKIAAEILTRLIDVVKPGISTYDIAKLVEKWIVEDYEAIPSSIGQYGFEYALNSSINNVICHGIPSKKDILIDGDIVNLDVTVKKYGFIADTSRMYFVGECSPEAIKLCRVTQECLYKGIKEVSLGKTLGDIGFHIHRHAIRNGYSIVKEFCGHGIGREMHEEPQVLHYGKKYKGQKLMKGMVFTIEPMVNQGAAAILEKEDGWTIETKDGRLSAQYEHTVALTSKGVEILTLREEEIPHYENS